MANLKTSEYPAMVNITFADLIEIVQGGVNKKTTLSQLFTLPNTVDSVSGVLYKSAVSFLHNFKPADADGENTFLGEYAGNFTMSAGGGSDLLASNNVGIGRWSLTSLTTGYENTGVGGHTLVLDTTGYKNTAVGYHAVDENTTGHDNTGVGDSVLLKNDSGDYNTAVGSNALVQSVSADENTGIGASALAVCTDGERNVAVGRAALIALTTGNNNTAIGFASGMELVTGSGNTLLGTHVAVAEDLTNNIILSCGAGAKAVFDGTKWTLYGDVVISGGGVILTAPDASKHRIKVANDGSLSTEVVV